MNAWTPRPGEEEEEKKKEEEQQQEEESPAPSASCDAVASLLPLIRPQQPRGVPKSLSRRVDPATGS